jgi:hypothetical protein
MHSAHPVGVLAIRGVSVSSISPVRSTRRWRKTDSNPRSLSGAEGDRTTPSLASNDFHGSKYPNGQSKTAEAAVVKQQFDSVWARADTALTASAFF